MGVGPSGREVFRPQLNWSQNRHNQTNICLGIQRQTCMATFNPTCLSRLIATQGLFVLSLLIVSDELYVMHASDDDWNKFTFLLTDSNLCLK